ncbi:XRE family transcriptional regulator [Gaoshiqia sediminis]|uniref:XRE family transcriptional regulator n=1 Tax=Gaoshiqia sediminis TaxID=2986998 RepID=A0AA41Y9J2_9BACT|nr:helix-turn-helix domain-containing protein [Gaoshiqia sediminis]MCW0484106.1 XRE family transcriptional regulator [Gaoshiqia sediminis]
MSDIGLNIKTLRGLKNVSQAALAEAIGVKPGTISNYEKGVSEPDLDKALLISKYFGVHIDSMIERTELERLKAELEDSPLMLGVPETELSKIGVPYFDIDVTASIKESFQDVAEVPEFYVDFKPFNDCTAYLPIWGDSMYPTYASGEIIAVKRLENPDVILWGEAYLIITNAEANNMKTIKLLFPHEEPDKLILRASNPNFKGDTVIPKKSVLNLYSIKGKITRKQL